jgi:uncharacterized protein (DUF1501 family)
MKLIPELLAGIAYVVRRAEELKIRDKLVVVMQSEMGRTPNYNKGNGKDHWSVGSVMFMGPGIKAGRDDTRAATVDFAPTLARLLRVQAPGDLDGRALSGVVGR